MQRGKSKAAQQPNQQAAAPQGDVQPVQDGWRALRSADIDRLAGDDLKQYARQAGVMARDVDGLSEDRLRQNVKVFVNDHLELICEG